MLSAALFLCALLAGVQAQDDLRNDGECVAESNGIDYAYCGRIAFFNIYWNWNAGVDGEEIEGGSIAMIFEVLDNGWHSMGFGQGDTPGTLMIGATVLFGCQDFVDFESTDVFDFQLPSRDGPAILEAIGADATATHDEVTQSRENGICAIRFERAAQPEVGILDETQFVDLDGTYLVFAMGDAAAFDVHDERTSMLVSLTDGLTELDPVIPLLEDEEEVEDDDDEEEMEDGGASMVALSKAAAAIVAAAAYALF